ncbi:MAG: phosphoribosyl-AMP cyclohydrolase, phosphoribosyl-ATP pyrophosphatase [Phycisphaerales bacterium]|nr:phosphoribosyl-AMP cyclohydrolase, phosphoribosyl-ATP pyrophosphatase [Phycisphaerales bacterium]
MDNGPLTSIVLTNPPPTPLNAGMDVQLEGLKFDSNGLIPAIVQDAASGEVLMMAWMNRASLDKTVATGKTHFFSRSRNKLWLKGESSGHVQHVKSIRTDCDKDTLLIHVEQVGAACHDGYYSCFYREHQLGPDWKVVGKKVFEPAAVYKK